MLRKAHTLRFLRICILVVSSVFIFACADVADLQEPPEFDLPTTPPNIKDEELDPLKEVFFGLYGCQTSPELSILNYDPQQVIEESGCDSNIVTEGSNPDQLFEMSDGMYQYLDTEIDASMSRELLVFANKGGLFQVDMVANSARRLTSWNGEICRIIPSTRYEVVPVDNTTDEIFELDAPFVYVEVVYDTSVNDPCSNVSVFRNYFKVAMNFDENADNVDICVSEEGGKSTASDCKTKQRPAVSEAKALSQPVVAYVGADGLFRYGYLGWGRDDNDQRTLNFWDENGALQWTQQRALESFGSVFGTEGVYPYLFDVDALEDTHHLLQMGRDVFVFEGHELFGAVDTDTLFSDRVYQLEESAGDVAKVEFVFDDNDLVFFDAGKFFHLDYTLGSTVPTPVKTYEFVTSLESTVEATTDDFEFSQFETQDCRYDADETACDAANDVGGTSWQVTTGCDVGLGCSFPVDLTDYCVTAAEQVQNTPAEDLCTPERYQDLNELDDPANDVAFTAFLQYYADHMRDLDFQIYDNKLLMNVRLSERDALVLYDYNQPATAPATVRESLLLGKRLVQSIAKPIIQDDNIYITSNILGLKTSNICYKGFSPVQCNFAKLEEGTSEECTSFDINAGTCREGKYLFESRALYCSATDIANEVCIDTNQINPKTLQVESATHDAKWLPVISIDDVNGLQREIRVLVSEDRQFSSNSPSQSYTKDEGVLGNPKMYKLDAPGSRTLSSISEGQLQGVVESVPGSMVLRDSEGAVSLTAEEFVGGSSVRQQDELYINENMDQIIRVTGSRRQQ
ncbi:hypothetical protein [Oleiphilus sp. HI0080]|uniref:hypothetical protein n=1 Tax=Oleiphilus sp. HI0080 TaxID=1822255 RepID=UPI0008394D8E|nr:hypothetical protein [Oleiphilus sp. HI0080]